MDEIVQPKTLDIPLTSSRFHFSNLFIVIATCSIILIRPNQFAESWISLLLSCFLIFGDASELQKVFNAGVIEHWLAAAALTAIIIGGIAFFFRTSERKNRFQILQQNFAVKIAGIIVIGLYTMIFLCPMIAPYDPDFQQDIIVTRYARPMQAITYLKLKPSGETILPFRQGDGIVVHAVNRLIQANHRLLNRNEPAIYVDQYRIEQPIVFYKQGLQNKQINLSELISSDESGFIDKRLYVLGSDRYGRDVLSRIIYGSRISLIIGLLAVTIAVTLGVAVGAVAGYFGKFADAVLMRFVDLMLSFPNLFLVLLVMALFGNSVFLIILVLGLTGWMGVSRLIRGQILSLKENEFVLAAKAMGFSHTRIIFRHLVPNAMAPVIVAATLRLGGLILVEAGLSFLGLGVQPPAASWGNIINEGRDTLIQAWWIATFPGLAIVVTVICFNVLGDGLRDVLDPRIATEDRIRN